MMQTKILKSYQIEEAVNLLRNGEIIALPTETVYGLAADASNDHAIHKIFIAKDRPLDHPLIVHIDAFDKANFYAENISAEAKKLAENFWPGPLTMILMKRKRISNLITAGLNTIALRVPNHSLTLEIIRKLGNGIVAPSANAHKKTSSTKPLHVLKTLGGKIAGVVDGGAYTIGIESTIIDMTKEIPVILRPGSITTEMIENVLKMKIECPFNHNERVSGNMKIHYQPEKPLFLLPLDQIESFSKKEDNIAIMHYSKISKSRDAIYYKMSKNKREYANSLYDTVHLIDNTNVDKILVETPPNLSEWSDIHDRLLKASKK